jgi:hypothetical protein
VLFQTPCDARERALFHSITHVTVGDGARALFWRSTWIGGAPLSLQFPRLFAQSRRKNKTVRQALIGSSWVRDLGRALPAHLLHDYLDLWRLLQGTALRHDVPDSITWVLSNNVSYSAALAYQMNFEGQTRSMAPAMIWKPWAPPKYKQFVCGCYCTTGYDAQIACNILSGRTSISASFA